MSFKFIVKLHNDNTVYHRIAFDFKHAVKCANEEFGEDKIKSVEQYIEPPEFQTEDYKKGFESRQGEVDRLTARVKELELIAFPLQHMNIQITDNTDQS